MPSRAIFIDLDGTLLNSQNQITPKTTEVIRKVAKEKYEVFLITGKSFQNSKHVYEKLNLQTPLITSGGQVLSWRVKHKYVHSKVFLEIQDVKKLINLPKIKGLVQHFLIETEEVLFKSNDKNLDLANLILHKKQKLKAFAEYQNENIIGFYFDLPKEVGKQISEVVRFLHEKFPNLSFSYWHTEYDFITITVSPRSVSKWKTIEQIQKKRKFEQIIVFGNGYADLEMIKKADVGYAMKNAFEHIKKSADKVTKFDNDHDGVAVEIENLL